MSNYAIVPQESLELYHHGIKGQKWGVRRFQDYDGTRFNAGKERRRKNENGGKIQQFKAKRKVAAEIRKVKRDIKKEERYARKLDDIVKSGDYKRITKNASKLSVDQLREANARLSEVNRVKENEFNQFDRSRRTMEGLIGTGVRVFELYKNVSNFKEQRDKNKRDAAKALIEKQEKALKEANQAKLYSEVFKDPETLKKALAEGKLSKQEDFKAGKDFMDLYGKILNPDGGGKKKKNKGGLDDGDENASTIATTNTSESNKDKHKEKKPAEDVVKDLHGTTVESIMKMMKEKQARKEAKAFVEKQDSIARLGESYHAPELAKEHKTSLNPLDYKDSIRNEFAKEIAKAQTGANYNSNIGSYQNNNPLGGVSPKVTIAQSKNHVAYIEKKMRDTYVRDLASNRSYDYVKDYLRDSKSNQYDFPVYLLWNDLK